VSILGELDSQTFIARYWQKEPLLLRGALESVSDRVDGDTLAGLACEPLVDSRLVIASAETQDWHCEHGPFEETRFAQLPAGGWTLLVQAVDQWIPEIAALLDHFDFLPRWRIDDIMVSFATDGGGVGPHFDYYDVFLLQLDGTRRWQVGQRCDGQSPLRDHPDLKLLKDFDVRDEWLLEAGDMLYLPPGVAHWGTAAGGNCITASIGFRAPSQPEVIQGAVEQMLLRFGEHQRFVDVPASVDADPFRINEAALESARSLWPGESLTESEDVLATAFGRLVTEPRTPALIGPEENLDAQALRVLVTGSEPLEFDHHPASRFAYRLAEEAAVLFVDGEAFSVTASVAKGVCHGRLGPDVRADEDTQALLADLIQSGSLIPRS
jgi:50S ribosomal protein L16 3-hydroxylase